MTTVYGMQYGEPKGGWKGITVRRNGVKLGSLRLIRQIYHLWEEEREAWAERSGEQGLLRSRRRKPEKATRLAVEIPSKPHNLLELI